jgi:peptidoglycan/xylan/chitin deacetylase (PgdA/CDA1 family)
MKWLFSDFIWDIPNKNKTVYLTFDDGPTPGITEWVLSQLQEHKVKAIFFCIGKNIKDNPHIFRKIIDSGHSLGNHTFNHENGWHTDNDQYMESVNKCEKQLREFNVDTKLFRPPYGKLRRKQAKILKSKNYKVVMWDILSADFDHNVSQEKCLQNVLKNITSGSVIIFHDSVKAFPNLKYVLPKTLEYIKNEGFNCGILN